MLTRKQLELLRFIHERLKEAGVPVTAKRYDGLIHGFFGMGLVLDAAKTAVPEVAGHLRAGLG